PDWNAVLGHELRSPVAAILGYQELLDEGTLGPLPDTAADALRRIRFAATQLITLIDAVEGSSNGQDAEAVPARDLIHDALSTVRFEAEGRGTLLRTDDADVDLFTRRTDACRALALILGAAVKVTPGGTLRVSARDADEPQITVTGSGLDPARDRLAHNRPLTGAGLRLELAGAAAARVSGTADLLPGGTVQLRLPRLSST
ncbi:MAG TPA: histidine kinase dimerization/phospho-acceptor domain-containing protein, partial [Longimicrobiales bacterium]|nr:histidine kinase dimerization/phospho-acceptor domain-containing protein [Longimicrobiales bacterium]